MAKTVVFLVHGMGNANSGWSTGKGGPVPTLIKAANHYPAFSDDQPLTGAIKFVEITYNDIFDGIRQQWADLAASLRADGVPEAAAEDVEKIAGLVASANADDFIATHILDVGLYCGFRVIQRLVQLKVASQMMKTIAENIGEPGERRRFIVVAHSLGTTIAHDAIQRMATAGWLSNADEVLQAMNTTGVGESVTRADIQAAIDAHGTNPFAPGKFRFEAIFQIANTSRLLGRTKPPYHSVVRPMYAGGPLETSTGLFYNVDHRLDPIGKLRRHRAEEAWPESAIDYTAEDLFDIRHLHDINVHSLEHYLIHPRVHANLFYAASPWRFTDSHFQLAMDRLAPDGDFPQIGPKYMDEDVNEEIRRRLLEILPDTPGKIPDVIQERAEGLLASVTLPKDVIKWAGMMLALENIIDEVRKEIGQ
ncbi:MAG: hypothetical protein U5O39_12550 [Gammaproteobacteria bacterium]|nr:hypothetical protein [Gammaproteobacteria bacterium]